MRLGNYKKHEDTPLKTDIKTNSQEIIDEIYP